MTKVEEVARAIWLESTSDGWDDGSGIEKRQHLESGLLRSVEDFYPQARAAIKAMLEPTPGMIDAGYDAGFNGTTEQDTVDIWGRMIDAALSEGEG